MRPYPFGGYSRRDRLACHPDEEGTRLLKEAGSLNAFEVTSSNVS